jgi:hypothetical protein
VVEANHLVRFPNADTRSVTAQRHRLWRARPADNDPPSVFAGYAEHHIADDPVYAGLSPHVRRRQALIGRAVEVGLPTVGFGLDATPGRHLAVLGTSLVGADILHAAALSLARQHEPGTARFVLAGFAAAADDVVDELSDALTAAGHNCVNADAKQLLDALAQLAGADTTPPTQHTYVVLFGADVAVPAMSTRTDRGGGLRRCGLDDLIDVFRGGPGRGVHVLSWWRIVKRFSDAIGGTGGREDVACLVGLNVPGTELVSLTGDYALENWLPRTNRAILIDRHDQRQALIVPFVLPGRHDDSDAAQQ